MRCQNSLFSLKKRRAVSDESKLSSSHRADDDERSDSRSDRSDVAVRCAAVNKRCSTSRQVTLSVKLLAVLQCLYGTLVIASYSNEYQQINSMFASTSAGVNINTSR